MEKNYCSYTSIRMTLWPPKVAISLGCTSPLTEKFNIIKILIKVLRNLNKGL